MADYDVYSRSKTTQATAVAGPMAIVAGAGIDAAGAATKYLVAPGGAHAAAQKALFYCRQACTLRNLNLVLQTASGGADTYAVTVQKSSDNGANWTDTTLTCTASAAGKTASDLTNAPALAAGDIVAVKVVSSGATAANSIVTIDVVPTV